MASAGWFGCRDCGLPTSFDVSDTGTTPAQGLIYSPPLAPTLNQWHLTLSVSGISGLAAGDNLYVEVGIVFQLDPTPPLPTPNLQIIYPPQTLKIQDTDSFTACPFRWYVSMYTSGSSVATATVRLIGSRL